MKKSDKRKKQEQVETFEAYGEYQYSYEPQDGSSAQTVENVRKTQAKRKSHVFFRFLLLLTIVTVGVVVAQQTVFRLETVYVIGNENRTPQQVVTASGLASGQNMLGIEEADVAKNIARDHTIIFKRMQKEYPNTIFLYIEERKTVAAMQWLGMLYTLDSQGMVMTEENSAILPPGLPVVTGFKADNVMEGQLLDLRDQTQLEAFQQIVFELEQQMYASQITGINLADPENLYLVTIEGVTVRLGDAQFMEGKIGAVRTCMSHLRQLNVDGGILDVTKVEDLSFGESEVKYMPEEHANQAYFTNVFSNS